MPLRPILISTVQYHDELLAGQMRQAEVARVAHRLGADGVELRADYWHDQEREIAALVTLLPALGLTATYATSWTLFAAAEGQAGLRQAVDDAAALGAVVVRVFQGAAPAADGDAAWAAARAAVDYAAARGVVLALENFARAPGCRVQEIRAVLDRLPSSALATNVDIGNYAVNGEDVPAAVRTLADRIAATHLRDQRDAPGGPETTELGGGMLPLPPTLAALAGLPQRVLHCFEFMGGGDPEGRIARSLAYLRTL